jgi:SWI/SNF-related matrix-associated actin-dependent regulator 1 of chromatin subfamily A
MIRRLKKDVLTELPDKTRQVVEISSQGYEKVLAKEQKRLSGYKDQVKGLSLGVTDFSEVARIRHETALAKVPAVVKHLKDLLEEQSKVVCFAWHRDVIEKINEAFKNSVVVTGATPLKKRQEYIDRFQADSNCCNLFIGNIMAAGTGITLTASSCVVFAELDWVPGNIAQAEDRCHRVGQSDNVLVQHVVLERSIDAYIAKMLVQKQEVIDTALDRKADTGPDADFLTALLKNA